MLFFKKRFLPAIRTGEKIQTLRKKNVYRAGQRSYIPGAGYIKIDSVMKITLHELSEEDAKADGFTDLESLRSELHVIYGDDLPPYFYRIRFHLLPEEEQKAIKQKKLRHPLHEHDTSADNLPSEKTKRAKKITKEEFPESESTQKVSSSQKPLRCLKLHPFTKVQDTNLMPGETDVPKKKKTSFTEESDKMTPFLTEHQTAEALLNRCRVHRNVCDWTHEPTKSQDFFAIFLKSPRTPQGIPKMDGYALLAQIRALVSEEEWEEDRWIITDVCQRWTEWQYAVERFSMEKS
ncbi:MAG: ASCH domain-containing protein [Planctomycetia bacterium]|nr:ASCH domain-containing protein [Planctomycetia bacterium]